jgi:hypothetical protein
MPSQTNPSNHLACWRKGFLLEVDHVDQDRIPTTGARFVRMTSQHGLVMRARRGRLMYTSTALDTLCFFGMLSHDSPSIDTKCLGRSPYVRVETMPGRAQSKSSLFSGYCSEVASIRSHPNPRVCLCNHTSRASVMKFSNFNSMDVVPHGVCDDHVCTM